MSGGTRMGHVITFSPFDECSTAQKLFKTLHSEYPLHGLSVILVKSSVPYQVMNPEKCPLCAF